MATNLNRRSQQRLKRMVDSLENITKAANKLRIEELEELVRRDSISVDGSTGNGTSVAVARSGGMPSSSPVERAVIQRMEGRQPRDPVREQVKSIERKIIQTEENMRQILTIMKALKDGEEKQRKRPTSEPCEICMVLPAVKTAMCVDCYTEWVEAGAPDRFRWKAFKRALTSSDGIPLVTEQPPARH